MTPTDKAAAGYSRTLASRMVPWSELPPDFRDAFVWRAEQVENDPARWLCSPDREEREFAYGVFTWRLVRGGEA